MASSEIAVQSVTFAGATPTFSSANVDGNFFTNDGFTVLYIKNDGGGELNVTIDSQTLCNQGFDHDEVITIGAGAEGVIGIFGKKRWNDINQFIQITYDTVTSVTVAVLSFPS